MYHSISHVRKSCEDPHVHVSHRNDADDFVAIVPDLLAGGEDAHEAQQDGRSTLHPNLSRGFLLMISPWTLIQCSSKRWRVQTEPWAGNPPQSISSLIMHWDFHLCRILYYLHTVSISKTITGQSGTKGNWWKGRGGVNVWINCDINAQSARRVY